MSYDLLQSGAREGLFFSESCSIYDDDDCWREEEEEKIPASDPAKNDQEPRTEFVYFLPCAKRIYDLLDKQTKRGLIEDAIERGFDGMTFMNDVGSGHTRTYTIEELKEESE